MIVIACHPRTGSSILVKCLEKSGYHLGGPLNGHYYASEYGPVLMVNRLIFNKFQINWDDGKVLYQKVEEEDPYLFELIKKCANKIERDGVEVIKDTQFGVVADIWAQVSPLFANALYIYLERDELETAKSEVRQRYKIHSHLPKVKTRFSQRRYQFHKTAWEDFLPKVKHVRVQYEEMLSYPRSVGRDLSMFLGREIDMSLIDPNKTYKASKRVY